MKSKLINWLKFRYNYSKAYLKQRISMLNKKNRANLEIRCNLINVARELTRYLGTQEANGDWIYECEDFRNGLTFSASYRITSPDNLPTVDLRLTKLVDGEDVTISKFEPTHFEKEDIGSMNEMYRIFGDFFQLEPSRVSLLALVLYKSKKEEIKNTPKYFYDTELEPISTIIPAINQISPFEYVCADISIDELKSLKKDLEAIMKSEELIGIKIRKAERAIVNIYTKYENMYYERINNQNKREKEQEEKRTGEEHKRPEGEKARNLEDKVKEKGSSNNTPFSGISGYRRDIKINVKSIWEANYARVLMYEGQSFSYEPRNFELKIPEDMRSIFSGKTTTTFTPDFHINGTNKFVEVKGDWFNYNGQEAMAKIILFKKQYPEFELEVIGIKEYRKLERNYKREINSSNFCGWEYGSRKRGHNLATTPQDFS